MADMSEESPLSVAASGDDESQSTPTKQRKNFTASDDLILLRSANTIKPWETPYGTANGVMKCFDKIAQMCSEAPSFVKDKPGTLLRTRFDKLVKQYREAECASRRASGTTEEYEEREILLQDIVQRMDGWRSTREDAKQAERAKSEGIEASGALMRRLAMGELEDELHQDSQSDTEEAHGHSSAESATTASSSPSVQKRGGSGGKGRNEKVSKSEKMHAVTDAIAVEIEGMAGGSAEKYTYLNNRLVSEREEADRKRQHEEKMEKRREEAELMREERTLAAERARETFMLHLLQVSLRRSSNDREVV